MRNIGILFFSVLSVSLLAATGAYGGIAPPASLAGLQIEFVFNDGETSSVPPQDLFGSDGYAQIGFSGSVLERIPYTYAQGVITYTDWGEEIRLSFTTPTSGSFESWEWDEVGYYLDEVGTFNLVTASLVLKNDWQHSETMNSPLSTDYWNVWRRSVDSLAYNEGELNFIFDAVINEFDAPGIDIEYGRTLPLDEDWQVVLDDIYAAPRLDQFEVQLDLDTNDKSFNCEMEFEDYGDGREVNLEIEYDPAVRFETSISASEDLRLLGGVNLRVRHNAASRDLLFEYQPDGASVWSELARFNLGSGTFTDIDGNVSSSNSGEVLSSSERMSVEIVAQDVRVATQIGDLEIAGIEIGSYTPSETTWYAGASYVSDGWRYFGWFKGFKPAGANWIYHGRHGWLYTLGADTSSLFLWDVALGRWMFTNEAAYPWIYAYGPDGGWVFFFEGGRPGSRYFKRGDNGQTLSEQNLSLNP